MKYLSHAELNNYFKKRFFFFSTLLMRDTRKFPVNYSIQFLLQEQPVHIDKIQIQTDKDKNKDGKQYLVMSNKLQTDLTCALLSSISKPLRNFAMGLDKLKPMILSITTISWKEKKKTIEKNI